MKRVALVAIGLFALAACSSSPAATGAGPAGTTGAPVVYGQVTVTGDALPEFAGDPATDVAIGMPAPVVSSVDLHGAPATLQTGQRPVVLVFLAHWCPHCQNELPRIVSWVGENQDGGGVDVYLVPTGTNETRPNFPPGPWIEASGWQGRVLVDDQQYAIGRAFGLTSYPYWVGLGKDGKVKIRLAGELTADKIPTFMDIVAGRLG